jgi:hypothetical protein
VQQRDGLNHQLEEVRSDKATLALQLANAQSV